MRKTSSRPRATPTRLCTVEGTDTGWTKWWNATTQADHTTQVRTRPMISRTIEPLMSKR